MKYTQLGTRRKWGQRPNVDHQERADGSETFSIRSIDLKNPLFYRDLHRYLSRYWKPHATPSEYAVLDFIFDRTIGWGKHWEIISLRHFVHGVWNEKKVYSDGTHLGVRTVQRALNGLLKKGMIRKECERGERCWYSLNLLWEPPKFRYLNGKTPYRPAGSETYWEDVADGKSKETYVVIQRDSEGIAESLYAATDDS